MEMVNQGHNYIGDVVDSDLADLVERGMLSATNDFSFIKDVDFVAVCVPTPLDAHQEPDISYVRDSVTTVSKHLKKGTMVVLESTTYPGTTEELIRPILEEGSGLKCGEDFYLGFSPERVDPGNLIYKDEEYAEGGRSLQYRWGRSDFSYVQGCFGRRSVYGIKSGSG